MAVLRRDIEDHSKRLHANSLEWATPTSAARHISASFVKSMVESQSPRLRAPWVGSEAELHLSKKPLRNAYLSIEGMEAYETSDPVRFHRQGRREPCERDFQAE